MDTQLQESVEYLIKLNSSSATRTLIAISSVPGGGKSTLGAALVAELLKRGIDSCLVGMDGFHYSRAELDAFEDPPEAHRRRGAAFTFNATAYLAFVQSIVNSHQEIRFPTFSHELKDPSPLPYSSTILPLPRHRIVILEGLYTNLDQPIWREAAVLCKERWRIELPRDEARTRLIERHLVTGVCSNRQEAEERVDRSDMMNGDWLLRNSLKPDRILQSVQDSRIR